MSGLPIFADPSTAVMYHTVPAASSSSGGTARHGFVAGGHPQHPPPPTVAMMVVQNNPQPQQHDSMANTPLPPGMEIVLGDKKYTIQYKSYEMTREKANEYIAKCTGTPFSRMSSPPDPNSIHGNRVEGRGGFGGTVAFTTAATDRFQRTKIPQGVPIAVAAPGIIPAAMTATRAGDRGSTLISPSAIAEEQQRQKTPDEVYTMMKPAAASGLPPPIAKGTSQQLPNPPEPPQVMGTTNESNSYLAAPTYAPMPPPLPATTGTDPQQQNLGYFWEDGAWKLWQASGSSDSAGGVMGEATNTSKMLPPLPVKQPPPQPPTVYASQVPPERPQYQYQYQYEYHYPSQQQQQQPPTTVATSAAHEPHSYVLPHSQQSVRCSLPLPPQPGILQAQGSTGSAASAPSVADPMLPRHMM